MPASAPPAGAEAGWRTAAALALLAALLSGCAQPFEALFANTTARPPPQAAPILRGAIADLHADGLMWGRDLLQRQPGIGHADLPRLAEGGVALQVFTVFTVTPPATAACLTPAEDGTPRQDCVDGDGTNLTALLQSFVLLRPREAVSPRKTVVGRARAFDDLVRRSQGTAHPLVHIRDAGDLRRVVELRQGGVAAIGAILGLEGAHPLDPRRVEEELDWLHGLGYRLVAPTHRFDNAFGGASEGVRAGGLTEVGEQLVRGAQQRGMVLDVAHLSNPGILRAVELAQRPLVYSHGGIASNCAPAGPAACVGHRNISPEAAAALARQGGVIGIGYWPEAVGTEGLASIASAVLRTRDELAARGVADPLGRIALGSDFDGFVRTAVDARGHPLVLGRLAAELGEADARRIGWTNACIALVRALGGATGNVGFCSPPPVSPGAGCR
jgi:microsomal dipeptidase-like Zn-dependent dipeptidase